MLPTIHGVARLVADPELRFTQNSNAVASVRLAFNSRRLNKQTNQWEDGDTFWVTGSAWNQLAENVAETLTKGMEVTVTGELRTRSWEKDGQKYERPELNIRSIGPSLAFQTAQVAKSAREQAPGNGQHRGQAQQPQRTQQTRQDDPWAVGGSGYTDEPPF